MKTKYKYDQSVNPPCIRLKEGCTGIVEELSLYQDGDFLRGHRLNSSTDIRLNLIDLTELLAFCEGKHYLEFCTDKDLEFLAEMPVLRNASSKPTRIPLSELRELRVLERRLRTRIGNYRRAIKTQACHYK